MLENKKIQRLERKIKYLKEENKSLKKKKLNLMLKRKKEHLEENIDTEMRFIQKVGKETGKISDKLLSDYYNTLIALNNSVDIELKNHAILGDVVAMQVVTSNLQEVMIEVLKTVLYEK